MSEAIAEALALQYAAAAEGFDWQDAAGFWDKLAEEIAELQNARNAMERQEELGDLLFMIVNLARHLAVAPTEALQKANAKFARRWQYIQSHSERLPVAPPAARLDAMEALWQEAKRLEVKSLESMQQPQDGTAV